MYKGIRSDRLTRAITNIRVYVLILQDPDACDHDDDDSITCHTYTTIRNKKQYIYICTEL